MKIGIDGSQIVYGAGVSFYTSNLINGLAKIDKKNQYLIFASSFRQKKNLQAKIRNLDLPKNFKTKILSLPPSYFEIFWNKIHVGRVERFVGNVDIFHSSDWVQPPSKKAKLVTTIHDLAILKYPQHFSSRILKNQKLRLKWIKEEADAIIAVSKSTKKDIIKYLKIDPKKIYVVYEAVPLEHQIKVSQKDIEKVKIKHNLKNYILFVGTREPRKNLIGLIKAFKLLFTNHYSPNTSLVIVGKYGWGKTKLKIKNEKLKIKLLDQVGNKELAALYSGAKVFVYPSFYEGFGLPILEAMNYGCPVITSNVSSLPEIAGKAAILVCPKNTKQISEAIKKVISNQSIYNKLREKGYSQVKKFSWRKTAQKTLKIYQSLVNNQ